MRILENTIEFQAYDAAKNGLLDSCDIDTLSKYIQPKDKSIDYALAGAAAAGKKTLSDFLIEHGADKKYLTLGEIYSLYKNAIQTHANTDNTLIEFAQYFFHFPYRNFHWYKHTDKVNSLLYHCGLSRYLSGVYDPKSPLPHLDSDDHEITTYLTSLENCAEIAAYLAATTANVLLLNSIIEQLDRDSDLYENVIQSFIWGAVKNDNRKLIQMFIARENDGKQGRWVNAAIYACIVFRRLNSFELVGQHGGINWRLLSHRAAASNRRDLLEYVNQYVHYYSDEYRYCTYPRRAEIVGYAAKYNHRDLIDYLLATYANTAYDEVAMRIAIDYKHDDLVAHLNNTSTHFKLKNWSALFFCNSNKTTTNTVPSLQT